MVHTPKLHLVDSGLLAHLLAADEERIAHDDQVTGRLLENFVAMQVVKHADWAQTGSPRSRSRPAPRSTRGTGALAKLRDRTRFRAGIVIYTGRPTLPLGDRLWAVPSAGCGHEAARWTA